MARSRNRQGRLSWVAGVRTAWRVAGDGEFFCPECGGDRGYQLLTGRRRLTLFRVPVLPRGAAAPTVECVACRTLTAPDALDTPTSTRLSMVLRDGVQTVVLAVLAAGGTESGAVRETAVRMVRAGGYPECTEERLLILLAALSSEEARNGPPTDGPAAEVDALEAELRSALAPLTPHLSRPGRETLLLDAARLAAADGPYRPAESAVLAAVGRTLDLAPNDTERLLAQTG